MTNPDSSSAGSEVSKRQHYTCCSFQYNDITLLSDNAVRVNGGQPHGSWEEETAGLHRLFIAWRYASDEARARRHEHRVLQHGLWAMVGRGSVHNVFLAVMPL